MPKPAIVANATETGTTPSTMSTLETSSAVHVRACSNASRKLPHWGSSGQDEARVARSWSGGARS